ncbi:hypothetical protein Ahy_A02g006460 isoform C [Arachis hypogaea]|uniref:MACPF domain-containing protein n=1 Tax=Arachis hypogaea TaxID=3818 RepID=A0A445EAC0_ARAHY|nr:hypothetical protein Ahy_A02g006460 isoform C [Arachis hypogaea]
MGEHVAAIHTATNALQALGRGFDVNFDTRLLYCKGVSGSRVVEVDEEHPRDMCLYDDVVVENVSRDIGCSQEPIERQNSGVYSFQEMVEYFNNKANVSGSFAIGSFNSAFSFTGSKLIDAAATKTLSSDGFYIPLAKVQLKKSHLTLQQNVKRVVPVSWDPPSLASFIENFGTHVITSITIGGKDVIYVKQHHSSPLSKLEIKNYIQEIGNQRVLILFPSIAKGFTLNLRLQHILAAKKYFLEFQIPRVWAPLRDRIPGHQRKEPVCPSLQFSIMGQKLYVSQEQITVGRRLVTGLRLCLEGNKQNRLSVHLQHLVSLPKILQPYWDNHVAIGAPKWQGPEEQDSRWFEPVKWKNFSHVSTAPIENPETFIGDSSGVYIVTGAQLGVWDFGPRNVLYMKLLYSRLPGCTIRRSLWDHTPIKSSKISTSGDSSSPDNSSSGSRENVVGNKLMKYVDLSEMSKGPQDPPGHWLVTGGKLGVEKGKIVLRKKKSI